MNLNCRTTQRYEPGIKHLFRDRSDIQFLDKPDVSLSLYFFRRNIKMFQVSLSVGKALRKELWELINGEREGKDIASLNRDEGKRGNSLKITQSQKTKKPVLR